MFKSGKRYLRFVVILGGLWLAPAVFAAHVNPHAANSSKAKSTKVSESQRTRRHMRRLARSRGTTTHSGSVTRASGRTSRRRYHERFSMSAFAAGITGGDVTEGEDTVVRQAAIDALGNMNG